MTDISMLVLSGLVLSGAAGAALGALFLGSLWWTTHRGALSPRPMLWFLGGQWARIGGVLVGFYLVGFHLGGGETWERLLACLAGFGITRLVGTWGIGSLKTGRARGGDRLERNADGNPVLPFPPSAQGGTGHAS
jgi:F1F0 ATPase subunit 2